MFFLPLTEGSNEEMTFDTRPPFPPFILVSGTAFSFRRACADDEVGNTALFFFFPLLESTDGTFFFFKAAGHATPDRRGSLPPPFFPMAR